MTLTIEVTDDELRRIRMQAALRHESLETYLRHRVAPDASLPSSRRTFPLIPADESHPLLTNERIDDLEDESWLRRGGSSPDEALSTS